MRCVIKETLRIKHTRAGRTFVVLIERFSVRLSNLSVAADLPITQRGAGKFSGRRSSTCWWLDEPTQGKEP